MNQEIQKNSNHQLMTYYQNGDERTRALITAGKFEIEKFEKVNAFNWSEKFPLMNVKNIEHSLELETPSIASIRKYKGDEMSIAFLVKMLEEIEMFFNVTNSMNDMQRLMTAKILFKKFYFLSVADFRLCLINAYSGKYGKIFNRIDGAVVVSWFDAYVDERHQVAQYISQQRNDQLKKEPAPHEIDREGIEKMISIFKGAVQVTKKKLHRPVFKTIEQYFEERKLNVHNCQCRLWELFQHEFENIVECKMFDGDFCTFFRWKLNGILYRINKGESIEKILAS